MNDGVVFIGTFHVPDRGHWIPAIGRMADFVATSVPGIISFDAYLDDAGTEGTVIYVHPTAGSLDRHLAIAAELINEGSEMVDVLRIELLGAPSPGTVDRLRASGITVTVKAHVTGIDR